MAHTVKYLERPLARLAAGQRWEMVSHFIGWVIDARPRAALAILLPVTPPVPTKHTPSATALPQLDRERGMATIRMLIMSMLSIRISADQCTYMLLLSSIV